MLTYLKDHILEEIDGAMDYMTKAIECKGNPCGEKFYRMSEMEIEHANAMLKMFNTYEKPKTVTDAEYSAMQKAILDSYSNNMVKFNEMKKVYWSM